MQTLERTCALRKVSENCGVIIGTRSREARLKRKKEKRKKKMNVLMFVVKWD
jgi:hypothetical protein